jgi:antitoxin ChpS
MTTASLRTVGGSVMVAIPRPLLDQLGLGPNMKVDVSVDGGRIVIERPAKPRYSLAELLAQCDPAAPATEEDQAWLAGQPVGDEII